jgi:uncharacterized protein (TIGR02266 family)
MDEISEKRRDTRVPLLLRIDYPGAPGYRDVTENLSAGGLFIRTDRSLPVGAHVPLVLSFPGLLEPLELDVEVAWARGPEGDVPAGVAVRIPAGDEAARQRLRALASAASDPRPPRRTYRILLVEDNPLIVTMYDAAMRKLGAADGTIDVAVDHARDGVEALARLQLKPRVDLVIADLYMPVMDGFTLVERLRADPDVMTTPVLAISAGGAEARARAMDLGVDVYLPKPVKFSEIVGTVRALLRMA